MALSLNFLPVPRSVSLSGGTLELHSGLIALAADPAADLRPAGLWAQAALQQYAGIDGEIVGGTNNSAVVTISLGGGSGHAQGYHLSVAADGIRILGDDAAGAFYGVMTLKQLLQTQGSTLPLLEIEDYPDFPARGVMYDISRDKVPTMETLYRLIDWLAALKINQFQLYTEHTFAYRQHPKVWATASPITAEQILALDAYCQERFVELVPNQNSFGHMYRFLKLPEYKHLAETDQKVLEWLDEVPFSLAPVDPGSIELVSSLYDELLPNFTSKLFNVGADETFDLGYGRSKQAVEEKGKGRVYLDFLLQIYQRVQKSRADNAVLGRHHQPVSRTGAGDSEGHDCAGMGLRGRASLRGKVGAVRQFRHPVLRLPRHVKLDDHRRTHRQYERQHPQRHRQRPEIRRDWRAEYRVG